MTRFNLAALQEQGMTPQEIKAFIRDKERSMYGGSQTYTTSTAGPRPPEPSYAPKPTPSKPVEAYTTSTTGPRPPEPKTTTTTTKSTDFQVLLDKNRKKDTPAMVQEEEPATLASFQALLRKLQGG